MKQLSKEEIIEKTKLVEECLAVTKKMCPSIEFLDPGSKNSRLKAYTRAGIINRHNRKEYEELFDLWALQEEQTSKRNENILYNFNRLAKELNQKINRIAIIGQPGSGKSTLLSKITDNQIYPPPIINNTTDATNWAEDRSCNLINKSRDYIFVDVPGYDTFMHPVDIFLSGFPFENFDHFFFIINGKIHNSDELIFNKIQNTSINYNIIRTFGESLNENEKRDYSENIRQKFNLPSIDKIIFVSNRTMSGIDNIKNIINKQIVYVKP